MADLTPSTVMAAYHRYMDAAMRFLRAGGYTERQCGACPYEHRCCELMVAATPFEAWAIIQYINEHWRRPRRLLRKLELRVQELAHHCRQYPQSKEGMERAADAWMLKRKKCVFYSREHGCTIYPVRPVSCRRVFSTRNCDNFEWSVPMERPETVRRRIELMFIDAQNPNRNWMELSEAVLTLHRYDLQGAGPGLLELVDAVNRGADDHHILMGAYGYAPAEGLTTPAHVE